MASGQNRPDHHRGHPGVMSGITHSLRRRRKTPDRSAVNPFVKYFLFFMNFFFMLVGIAFTAVGTYILVEKEKTVSSFVEFVFDPACLLCLGGCIILVVAFFGCGGALREYIPFLRIYYTVMSVLLLLEVLLIILVFVFYFVDGAFADIGLYPEDSFEEAIEKYRDDPDMQDFIDTMQELFSCCGASNDDEGYKDWNKNKYFNCTSPKGSAESCTVPYSCCKISEGDQINYRCGADMLDDAKTDKSAINTKGCLKGLQDFITENIWIFGGVVLGVLLPQAFFICMAKALVAQVEEQMSKW